MLSIDKIKSHLKNMIPNIIVFTKYIKETDNGRTIGDNFITVNKILNNFNIGKIKVGKKELRENDSKYYGFIISRILLHNIFEDKNTSYGQILENNDSIISFKDEFGKLKFLSNDINYLFKDINEINFDEIEKIKGESGNFIDYYLGKINGEYTSFIIDNIANKINLGILLNPKLWHKDITILRKYIELKYIILYYYGEIIIDDKMDIYQQIDIMKEVIDKDNLLTNKIQTKIENEKELNDKIVKKFKDITKELKQSKTNIFSQQKNKKMNANQFLDLKEYIFKYGFYKK